MTPISVICPSRGRPDRWARMVLSAHDLAASPARVNFIVLVDADDPRVAEYVNSARVWTTVLVNRENRSAPALYNELACRHAGGELVVAASDDVVFRTRGWDLELDRFRAQFPDGLAVDYFDDGRNRDKCEHFVASRAWIDAVGYFMWPQYEHFCADTHVGEIARQAGRLRYLRGVVLEHCHFKYGKAAKDETYLAKRRDAMHLRDEALFAWFAGERQAAATRVLAAIGAAQRQGKGAA